MSKYSTGSDKYKDSSSRSHHRVSHRSPSPVSSKSRNKPGDEKVLPKSFGRREDAEKDVDDANVLQRMKTSFDNSPLQRLYSYKKAHKKVKIWTRNFKEIRGVTTGYVVAFDKHWNMVMRDVDEVCLKRKKNKTPFLRDVATNENLPDMPTKVPRKKKTPEEKAAAEAAAAAPKPSESESESQEKSEKKEKRKKKKNKMVTDKRHVEQLFIRGDSIVMITPIEDEDEEECE